MDSPAPKMTKWMANKARGAEDESVCGDDLLIQSASYTAALMLLLIQSA
jgi:hypothetical protein